MKRVFSLPVVLIALVAAPCLAQSARAADLDIKRGVPNDVFLAVYGRHNPERDFQKAYYDEVWKAIQDTNIVNKVVKIVTTQMNDDQVQGVKSVLDELRTAAEPISIEALGACSEMVYAQRMVIPSADHLLILRLTPADAESTVKGITNLFGVAAKYLQGAATIENGQVGDAQLTTLAFPPNVPFQPTVAQLNDLLIIGSTKALAEKSIQMMTGDGGPSKFDDPRLQAALKKLPQAEDSIVFFDGKQEFKALRGFGPFIRQASGNDPAADRLVEFVNLVIDETEIFDYEITVEYTEGNLNRSASIGHRLPGTNKATLRQMMGSGQPFEAWHKWVPAGAVSYSLGTGINLHPLYAKIVEVIQQKVPEAQQGLEQFEAIQQQIGVHLDRDILQSFSGEYISVTMPSARTGLGGGQDSFFALRCTQPERIKALLNRGIAMLEQHPAAKQQQIKLVDAEGLEGFQELSAMTLALMQVKPVIGFHDGWMILGSSKEAVKKILDTRAGNGETIETTDAFKKLQMQVDGAVHSISYTDTAASTRAAAQMMRQIGIMGPAMLAAAGQNADPEAMQLIQQLFGLLPDVATIVQKFDFLEAKIAVSQQGDDADTYVKRSVVVVRPAEGS